MDALDAWLQRLPVHRYVRGHAQSAPRVDRCLFIDLRDVSRYCLDSLLCKADVQTKRMRGVDLARCSMQLLSIAVLLRT